MKKTALIGSIFFALPLVVSAAELVQFSYFYNLLGNITNLIEMAIPILIGIALIIFFWGLVQYVRQPEIGEGKKVMIAGIVALFLMVSVWGIVRLAQSIFNVDSDNPLPAPGVPR